MKNNLIGSFGLVIWAGFGNQTLRLTGNTFLSGGSSFLLQPPTTEAQARPVTVVAEGNLFLDYGLLNGPDARMPSEKVTCAQVKMAGQRQPLRALPAAYVAFTQEKREVTSLKDWNQLWGQAEPGSLEVPAGGLRVTDAELRAVRQASEALLRGLGPAVLGVGPDWDLIGPGDAYVKALEKAAGKPLPKEELRPGPAAGGPFVLLRKEEAPRGYPSLDEAVSAWRDGDMIEVRADGPIGFAFIKDPERGGRLVIRAAAGYRPVVTGGITLQLPKAEVEIAGLSFAESALGAACARLTMRNSALRNTKEGWTVGLQNCVTTRLNPAVPRLASQRMSRRLRISVSSWCFLTGSRWPRVRHRMWPSRSSRTMVG